MAWMKVAPGFLGRTAADLFHPLFMEMLGNTGDAGATVLAYPQVSADLTAGAWNRVGSANNRIEIRLR